MWRTETGAVMEQRGQRPHAFGRRELEQELLEIIRQLSVEVYPGQPLPDLTSHSDLERDAGLDSLGRMELVLRMERRLGVRLPDDVAVAAETPADLLDSLPYQGAIAPDGRKAERPAAPRVEAVPPAAMPDHVQTIPEVLEWHAHHSGDRRYLTLFDDDGDGPALTYAELRDGAAGVAAGLRDTGIGPGDTVALMLPTGLDFFFAFHGVQWAGAIPVPLYPPVRTSQVEDHLRRIAVVLEHSGTRCFIASDETVQAGHLLKGLVPDLETVTTVGQLQSDTGGMPRVPRAAEDIAFLQYTSGTTGNPKGVTLTHANLLANIRTIVEVIDADHNDHFVSWLPLYHDMGLIGACLGTLYAGAPLTLMSPLQFMARPQRWLWAIHRYGGTLSAAPNFAYDLCAHRLAEEDLAGLDLSTWRVAFNGAEPVSPRTLEAFQKRFGPCGFRSETMKPVYGLAETSVGLTFPPLDRAPVVEHIRREPFEREGRAEPAGSRDEDRLPMVACGSVLPGHEIRVVDDQGRPLQERRQGELQFRGPSCTSGYYRDPEATARLITPDGWLNSGDLAYLGDGELFITGRVKDVIIRGGRNFYPYELEQAVSRIDGVRRNNVAVFASPDPDTAADRLVVVAETRVTDPTRRQELEHAIRDTALRLLETAPEVVVLAPPESVPKTSSGKIRRPACRQLFERGDLGRTRGIPAQISRLLLRGALPLARRGARALGRGVYGSWVWIQGSLLTLLLSVLLLIMPGQTARAGAARWTTRAIFALAGAGPVTRGAESLPDRPCVIVSNHASYLDGPVLRAALPGALLFLIKRELAKLPVLSLLLRRAGGDWMERHDRRQALEDLERATERLKRGQRLVFFPEGGLSPSPGLQPFRTGAFTAAARTGTPVVPVVIRGSRAMLPADSLLPRPGRIHVEVGEPMHPEGDDWHAALELRNRCRAWILERSGEPDVTG